MNQGVARIEEIDTLLHIGHRSLISGRLFIVAILFITLLAVLFHKLLENPRSNHPELSMVLRRIALPSL